MACDADFLKMGFCHEVEHALVFGRSGIEWEMDKARLSSFVLFLFNRKRRVFHQRRAMMNEQEMQFADPDWKPAESFSERPEDSPAGSINGHTRTLSRDSSESYEQGYRGSWERKEESPEYVLFAARQIADRSAGIEPRRSLWWLWPIAIILLIALLGTLAYSLGFPGKGPGIGERGGFEQSGFGAPSFRQPVPVQSSFFYGLKGATQLTINNQSGSIIVKATNSNTNGVDIQTDDGSQPTVVYNGNTITITSHTGGDVGVVIPQNLTLHLMTTGAGVIEVDGFAGQLSARTDSGLIALNGDMLTGPSTVNSNSANINLNDDSLRGTVAVSTGGDGDIGFVGTLDPQGKYRFITERGDIELLLPPATSIRVQDLSSSGLFHNDFANNPMGNMPQAAVTVETSGGEVAIRHP